MSRGWIESSINVPASAGDMPSGGSYMGATESPGSGSRPLYHQNVNITPRVTKGRKMMGLLPRNQSARVNELGSCRMPFGMEISIVTPPRMGSGLVFSNETSELVTSEVTSRSVAP